jgi:hypothetical protein
LFIRFFDSFFRWTSTKTEMPSAITTRTSCHLEFQQMFFEVRLDLSDVVANFLVGHKLRFMTRTVKSKWCYNGLCHSSCLPPHFVSFFLYRVCHPVVKDIEECIFKWPVILLRGFELIQVEFGHGGTLTYET